MIMQDVGKTTQINVKIKIRGVEETAHKKLIIQKVYLLWDVVAATKLWQVRDAFLSKKCSFFEHCSKGL